MSTLVKTTENSKTFNSKEMLRNEGFNFSAVAKIWYKEYESEEQFKAFESKFRSATYAGRKQARFNEDVSFEVINK
jgi:hypothetical protein